MSAGCGVWIDARTGEAFPADVDGGVTEAEAEKAGYVFLANAVEPEDNEWVPEFVARQLARLNSMREGVSAQFDASIATLQNQKARQLRAICAEENYVRFKHWKVTKESVASRIESEPGKKKSWDCKWGRFAFRAQKEEMVIEDEPKALLYLEAWEPDCVNVKKTIKATETRKAYEALRASALEGVEPGEDLPADAVIVPGMKLVARQDAFGFKP